MSKWQEIHHCRVPNIVTVFSDFAKGGVIHIVNDVHFVHKIIILGNMFKKENKKTLTDAGKKYYKDKGMLLG